MVPREDDLSDARRHPEQFKQLAAIEQKLDVISRRFGLPNCTLSEFAAIANVDTGVRLVAENFKRRSLIIINNTAFIVYVHTRQLNGNNSTRWMPIYSGSFWEPMNVPTNEIFVIGSSGAQEIIGYEGT